MVSRGLRNSIATGENKATDLVNAKVLRQLCFVVHVANAGVMCERQARFVESGE